MPVLQYKKNELLFWFVCSLLVHFFIVFLSSVFIVKEKIQAPKVPQQPTIVALHIHSKLKNETASSNNNMSKTEPRAGVKKPISKQYTKSPQLEEHHKKKNQIEKSTYERIQKTVKEAHINQKKITPPNFTDKNLDMTIPKDLLIDSQKSLPDIFDPKLRQRLKEARAAKHKNSLSNEVSDFYMQGRDSIYIQDHNCYEEKRNDGELNGQGFWLPQRCSWIKTESDKMMEGVNDAIKNTNSAPFIP